MRQIKPYPLWLGHVGDVRDLRAVHAAGITAVVDLALNEMPPTITRELVYCRFPLCDGSNNSPWILRVAIETIASLLGKGAPTLVYCGAGMSRSPAIAAGALALWSDRSPNECLQEVLDGGPSDVTPGLWRDVCSLFSK